MLTGNQAYTSNFKDKIQIIRLAKSEMVIGSGQLFDFFPDTNNRFVLSLLFPIFF